MGVRGIGLCLLLLLAAPARAEVVDRVMWVVGDELVLASDLELDAVLTVLDPTPFWTLPRQRPEERSVEAAMLRRLAGDLPLYTPREEEVRARVERVRDQFRDRAAWEDFLGGWGLDERALATALRRRIVVERYLARNLAAPPEDTERWQAACRELLDDVRDRLRIRYVEPRGLPEEP